jgi:nucleoside-diphosphate-sugar epimerase
MSAKPTILIHGGLGFIGRNLVQYLAENGLVSKIRVSDKQLPDLVRLSKKQSEIFKSDLVEFKQANLAREGFFNCLFAKFDLLKAMVNKVYDEGSIKWDFVVNLAGETKYSETEEVTLIFQGQYL